MVLILKVVHPSGYCPATAQERISDAAAPGSLQNVSHWMVQKAFW